jgi:phosphoribosylanthranilate isomerase
MPEAVGKILRDFPAALKKAAVFVNADTDAIGKYIDSGVDTIQLHGDENADFAEKLKKGFGLEIWKALRPRSKEEVDSFRSFPADKFLLDAFSASARGGTGKTADWKLAAYAVETLNAPVILAGGLKLANISEALSVVSPFGVDLSSGVEKSPGIKDEKLIKEFFSAPEIKSRLNFDG